MKLSGVRQADIVLVDKGGRRFLALVVAVERGEVTIRPVCPNVSYRTAGAREVKAHWRKAAGGQAGGAGMRLLPRISIYGALHALPRPFLDYRNEGPEWHYIAFGISARHTDSLITVEIDLGRRPA